MGRQQVFLELLADGGNTGLWTYRAAEPQLWADANARRLLRCANATTLAGLLRAVDRACRQALRAEIEKACAQRSGFVRRVHLEGEEGTRCSLSLRGRWQHEDASDAGVLFCVVELQSPRRDPVQLEHTLSEAHMLVALDQAPIAIFLARLPQISFVYINTHFEQLTGFTREEVVGTDADQLRLWHLPQERASFLETLKSQGHVRNFHAGYRHKSGHAVRVLLSAEQLEVHGQTLLLSMAHEVSALEDVRDKLAFSEARYRLLAEASSEGVALVKDGIVVDANAQIAHILGLSYGEVIGHPVTQSMQVALAAEHETDGQHGTAPKQYEYVRSDGTLLSLEVSSRRLVEGAHVMHMAMLRDVTGQVESERSLRNLKASLDHLMESNMIGMMLVEVGGTILEANDYILKLLHRSRFELQAGVLNWLQITPPRNTWPTRCACACMSRC